MYSNAPCSENGTVFANPRLTARPARCMQVSGDHTMNDSSNDNPKDPAQLGLNLPAVTSLPAVRAAKKATAMSRVHRRLIEPVELTEQDNELAFQHSVFCQTSLPYRNPGDDVRQWQRTQGTTVLQIEAGFVFQPPLKTYAPVGLPWGAKPRLILAYLNAEAIRQHSPLIEIETSLSAFVKRIRRFDSGREIRAFKDQLSRLSAARISLALPHSDTRASQLNTNIIEGFEVWFQKDERQRVLWPTTIQFSERYYNSLQEHAVPLNEHDLAALAHSALAIDIYSWLAQRLHRVNPNRPSFIQWPALKVQFGPHYKRMDHFKEEFRKKLRQVHCRYKAARFETDDHGMRLFNSPPPVNKRLVMLPSSKSGPQS
jgi:hypothetical protein